MPYTEKQKAAARMDLRLMRAGKKPRVMKGMTEEELRHMAAAPTKRAVKKPAMKHKAKRKGAG